MDASDDLALASLLDAFGAAFSIDEIAAAYVKSGRNAAAAADALSDDIATTKPTSFSSKAKFRPASMGTVSGIIGKQYVSKRASDCNGGKAARVDMKDRVLPVPESWAAEVEKEEKAESCGSGDDVLHKDMDDFLFTMLGEGFALERDLIRDVLDSCGYDMEKSMADLISLSTSDSDERKEVICKSSVQSAYLCLEAEVSSQDENIKSTEINGDRAPKKNGVEFNGKEKKRIDLQKEVLAALFSAPEKLEEPELSRERVVRRNGYANYGNVVEGPLKETFLGSRTPVVYQQNHTEDDAGEEERYQVLRRSVKEYRSTMKEYYQAAVEAFSKGDRVRAAKLVEQGQFFQKKARDADEESNKMIFKPRSAETEENIVLDLQDGGAKEAIRLLKCHLSSFAGISSIKHLKVIIDSEGGSKKGTRRRLAVLRLLDEESIKWVEEEENAGTLLIQMDSINPKKLNFLKRIVSCRRKGTEIQIAR